MKANKAFLEMLKDEDNFTFTENGGGALNSTGTWCLDAFGTLGAMKDESENNILTTFYKAYAENPETAISDIQRSSNVFPSRPI